jgi:hypothetical protein
MADRVTHLFREWHDLGAAVLLAEMDGLRRVRRPEAVIAESTAYCRASGRLTWVVLDWLIRHVAQIDEAALIRETAAYGDRSVLGVLCDAAYQRNPDPAFERLMRACTPHSEIVPFFHRVARSPLAARLAREGALDVFLRWNFFCNELRYLSDEVGRGAEVSARGAMGR